MANTACRLSNELKKLKSQRRNARRAESSSEREKKIIKVLQLRLLRIQQAVWHQKARAVIVFEGFDAAGKGGVIRTITESLDPRSVSVHPIGKPLAQEQGIHYLYRFWTRLPPPGVVAIFDRSWYGRLLVERVEKLAPDNGWKRAFREINEFERMLAEDGVHLIKFFLAISKQEQLRRFEARLHDPYKQWKLTWDDIRAREKWDDYVEAADDLLDRTETRHSRWHVINAEDKHRARVAVMEKLMRHFQSFEQWIEAKKKTMPEEKEIREALKRLE